MLIRRTFLGAAFVAALAPAAGAQPAPAILGTYADIAAAMYGDALAGARRLREAVGALVATIRPRRRWPPPARPGSPPACPTSRPRPSASATRSSTTWEGRVNAWPLDEGLIDYVDAAATATPTTRTRCYTANVIANPR